MFNWLKTTLSNGIWKTMAFVIVFMLAGPELMVGMELMALVEMLGASTFVLMYYTSLKLTLLKIWKRYKNFERHSVFFVPPVFALKQMPSLLIHIVPERTASIGFLACIFFGMFGIYKTMLFGV